MAKILPPPSCNVYTPSILANAMVQALGIAKNAKWLEPCVGKGAIISAMSDAGVKPHEVTGLDLSSSVEQTDRYATVTRSTEFLSWALETTMRFDRVVANPPYIALNKLPSKIGGAASRHYAPDGTSVALTSNCWYAFLCASLRLLNPKGSIAFLLPSAFDYADYAIPLRQQLPLLFERFEIHRSHVPLFEHVDDGTIVMVGHKYREPSVYTFRAEYPGLTELSLGLTNHGQQKPTTKNKSKGNRIASVALHKIMTIRIGAVTGDAKYFLLTEEERLQHGLPESSVHPAVSRSKHILFPEISLDRWNEMRESGERVWLFRPTNGSMKSKFVRQYLELGDQHGACNVDAYKIVNREPWYITPIPTTPDGFISGMCQSGPVVCFRRMKQLTATNTLFTVNFEPNIRPQERLAWALMLLTSDVRKQVNERARRYALGLRKLEPSDLHAILLPKPSIVEVTKKKYKQAVEAAMNMDFADSSRIADSYIDS